MTNREFYNAVANGTMSDEIKGFAKDAIVKMDERNAKRKRNSKPSKTTVKYDVVSARDVIALLREKGLK